MIAEGFAQLRSFLGGYLDFPPEKQNALAPFSGASAFEKRTLM
jgi:hypothetical protein